MNNLPWRYLLPVFENCAIVLLEILPWGTIILLQSLKVVHLHNNGNPALEAWLSQNNVSSLTPEGKFYIESAIAQVQIHCKFCFRNKDYFYMEEFIFCPWCSLTFLHISRQNSCNVLWGRSSVLLMPLCTNQPCRAAVAVGRVKQVGPVPANVTSTSTPLG